MTMIKQLWLNQFTGSQVDVAPEPEEAPPTAGGISVNTASLEELTAVNGLGEAMARQIIEGRPWEALSDLTAVRGISAAALDRWTELTL